MKKICIQSGHKNVTSGQTGTAGEQELNWRVTLRLSEILIQKGFQLFIVDANPPDLQINQDFDFFLAIHGDWDSPLYGGGCISAPDPAYDDSNTESKRIVDSIRKSYFSPYTEDTGIVERPNKVTIDMTRYYMWNKLTSATPCGLIELGEVMDSHDKVILADTDRVCNAIAKGICKAFNVPFDTISPLPPIVDWEAKYNAEFKKNQELNVQFLQQKNQFDVANGKINKAKQDLA